MRNFQGFCFILIFPRVPRSRDSLRDGGEHEAERVFVCSNIQVEINTFKNIWLRFRHQGFSSILCLKCFFLLLRQQLFYMRLLKGREINSFRRNVEK